MCVLFEDCCVVLCWVSVWVVLVVLLDVVCGVLLVLLVEVWFVEGVLFWCWVVVLFGLSLV